MMVNLASLLKHRGCQLTEPVQLRRPLQSARRLASSPWFAAGWLLAAVAWLVHVAALSMAPISLVQALLAGGAGLALLVLTVPNFQGSHSSFSTAGMLSFEGGLALLAAGLAYGHRSERFPDHGNVLFAALAGTLFALAGIAIKGLTG